MSKKIKSKKCTPCQAGEPPMSRGEIKKNLKKLEFDWELEEQPDRLVKIYEFKDFSSAIDFVKKVAKVAEEEGHHPNIYVHNYNKVKIELWTHKIGGLHQNDFIMASKIEDLAQEYL